MVDGILIRDASGAVTLNTAWRVSRRIGDIVVTDSGSLVVPEFNNGQGWAVMIRATSNRTQYTQGTCVVSGDTITWEWSTTRPPVLIVYGVY